MSVYRIHLLNCPTCDRDYTLRVFIDDVSFLDCSWCGFRETLSEGIPGKPQGGDVKRESQFGFKEPVMFNGDAGYGATSTAWLAGEAGATIIDAEGAEVFVPWWNIAYVHTPRDA